MARRDLTGGPVWDPQLKRYICDLRLPDGRRIKRRFRRERRAQRWWNRKQAGIDDGTWAEVPPPKRLKFGQALDLYRESARATNASFRSFTEPALRFWERTFGRDIPLAKVTTHSIEQARGRRVEETSKSTANKNILVLKRVFSWLESRELYFSNPAKAIKLIKVNNERVVYLEAEQFQRLLDACGKGPWYLEPIVIVAAGTGLRKGNVLGLKWGYIDFLARTIRLTNTKTLETAAIPMSDSVYETLHGLHTSRPGRVESEYVFFKIDSDQRLDGNS